MTLTEVKGALHSSCICMWCPACEFFIECEDNDKCGECGGECEYKDYGCDGACWDYAKDDVENFLSEWMKAVDTEAFAIYGYGMGWRRVSGHTGRLENVSDLIDNMTFSGDWTIEWTFSPEDAKFTMVRRSHDELGAAFELRPWTEGDDE